jgi:eukaryotic-like serine/threonine-protein kinase
MEWVDGTPITQYCDDHALDVAGRLHLFTKACDAVAAAHRSLVVHRDLKPSHILVTRDGGVKLLDFGVAKLIDAPACSDVTQAAGVPFTPDYASPEHVSGGPITTATDVYSLGAVLYELLTGTPPHRFTSSSPPEIERSIRDHDPVRPSLAIAARSLPTTEAALARQEAPGVARLRSPRRARHLAGDLDAIVLKALRKDPRRRYPSVDLLRQDIDHHLRGLPVLARPDHWTYRLRKVVTRHRAAAVAAVLVAGSLVAGLAGTLVQAGRVAAEREVARAEADRARRVTTLLADIFSLADPATTQGAVITAREILDQGTRRIDSELSGDPVTQAALLEAVGQVYLNLALLDSAEPLLERALALRATGGASPPEIAGVLHRLGLVKLARSEYGDAESRLREAVAMRRDPTSPAIDLAASLEALGDAVSELGRYDEAEGLLAEAVDLRREHDPRGPKLLESLHSLAWTLHRKGDLDRAERLFREAVEAGRSLGDVVTPSRVRAMLDLARIVHRFDRSPQAALPLYREALDLARMLHHSDHPQVALCLSELAGGPARAGRAGRRRSAWTRCPRDVPAPARRSPPRGPDRYAAAGWNPRPARPPRRSRIAFSRSARVGPRGVR